MLTAEIQPMDCRQVRSYRKEITLRLRLLADGVEVLAADYTEPLGLDHLSGIGDQESADARPMTADAAMDGLVRRFKVRMQAAIEKYKAEQAFLKTPEMDRMIANLNAGLVVDP